MLHVVLPASNISVPAARRAAQTVCLAAGHSPALCDILGLLTSELVTNAVRHSPGHPIDVTVTVAPHGGQQAPNTDRLRVEVVDRDPTLPALRAPEVEAENGRGMQLVALFSAAWGAAANGNGKTVWFELTADSIPGPCSLP